MSLKDSTKKRRILPAASDEMRHSIYVFLSRDDNSSLCPAKAASTCCEEGRKEIQRGFKGGQSGEEYL